MSVTRVADLSAAIAGRDERSIPVTLGGLEVDADATHLRVSGSNDEYDLDEVAEKAFARYLHIPGTYLHQIPPALKAANLNGRFNQWVDSEATLQVAGGKVVGIHRADLTVLALSDVVGVVERVFDPEYEIRRFLVDDRSFHIDVLTPHHVEVGPRTDGAIEGRMEGDITHGGIRLLASPGRHEDPTIQRYFERLWCANGCSNPHEMGAIKLKGNTVPEILAEMEAKTQEILAGLDDDLAQYAEMANVQVPGSPLAFAEAVLREGRIRGRVRDRVIDLVEQLPDDASLYDVQNAFTQVANNDIRYSTMRRLQRIGGDMAVQTDHVLNRCRTCEQHLPG